MLLALECQSDCFTVGLVFFFFTGFLRLLHKSVGNTKADKYQYREKHKSWDRTIKALNPKMKLPHNNQEKRLSGL